MNAAVTLAQTLVRIDTAGGNEDEALDVVAGLLAADGFAIDHVPWAAGRSNLVARWNGGGALTLAAHVDTVPFDARAWTVDPLGGEVRGGRLYGRGSSDMKGGLAAMVDAALRSARRGCRGFTLVVTSGEETGCHGARAVAGSGLLASDPLLIIGEATGNQVLFGHKGATWLDVVARGVAAHGSRPELGINAIELLCEGIDTLRRLGPLVQHPVLGGRTTNVGTISGGAQTNLVPDHARMSVDVRTVDDGDLEEVLRVLDGAGLTPTVALDLPSLWTDPGHATSRAVTTIVEGITRMQSPGGAATYFTDGAVLAGRTPRAYIIGPGDPDQPHATNEWCSTGRIIEAADIYVALLEGWDESELIDGPTTGGSL